MRLNSIKPAAGSRKSIKRVGRGCGSGSGKTCGAGHKGQKSRTGGGAKPGFEGGQMPLQRRLPKFGFRSIKSRYTEQVTTFELNKVSDASVNLYSLRKDGLIRHSTKYVKVVLSGELQKAIELQGIRATKGAVAMIERQGGWLTSKVDVKVDKDKIATSDSEFVDQQG